MKVQLLNVGHAETCTINAFQMAKNVSDIAMKNTLKCAPHTSIHTNTYILNDVSANQCVSCVLIVIIVKRSISLYTNGYWWLKHSREVSKHRTVFEDTLQFKSHFTKRRSEKRASCNCNSTGYSSCNCNAI